MLSQRVGRFTESVIRGMTRECMRYGGVNLAQGFPDFDGPEEIKEAARRAITDGWNQYAITWGSPNIRKAIARKTARFNGFEPDPETEITVVCGATEGMIATLMAILNPGEEVVIFEPFYENYGPDTFLSGSVPRFVPLRPPDFTFDPEELRGAVGPATKAVILNTPHNPTGHVFTRAELESIRDLCVEFDIFAVTDEVYEHIVFDGRPHVSLASLDGMRERTITINSLSKTYSVTGWRVGYVLAPEEVTAGVRKVHDFLTVGAPAPLQEAAAAALSLPDAYYADLAAMYQAKRELLQGVTFSARRSRSSSRKGPITSWRTFPVSGLRTTWTSPCASSASTAWRRFPGAASITRREWGERARGGGILSGSRSPRRTRCFMTPASGCWAW